jgi:2-hydroxychromene-2-carboxylate isomerase
MLGELFSETGGLPLIKRHPVRQRYRCSNCNAGREKRGLNFHLRPAYVPFNGRLADGVVIAAVEAGHDPDGFLRRVFPGMFEQQINLADPAVVIWRGDVFGSPAYVLDGEVFWGQDRIELLADALKSGRPPFSSQG